MRPTTLVCLCALALFLGSSDLDEKSRLAYGMVAAFLGGMLVSRHMSNYPPDSR